MQEAEIRRIAILSQPRQVLETYLKNTHPKKGWWSDSRCRP
jgi:hypothetical protein